MGKAIIDDYTTKTPLQMMGEMAGACWGAKNTDAYSNIKRARDCIESGHGRVMEYPDVYLILDGYSARVMREFYTHIGGAPTRLQASTRYIQYGDFDYIIPQSIEKNVQAKEDYMGMMRVVSECYRSLEEQGIPKEDIANILPLGMTTKVCVKINLRTLVDMSHQRKCTRAYWEFRQLFSDIEKALKEYSPEWEELTKLFVPKCELTGTCSEKFSCGRKPKKES